MIVFSDGRKKYRAKVGDAEALIKLMKEPYDIYFCSDIDGKKFCTKINRVDAAKLLIGKPVRAMCGNTKCTITMEGGKLVARKRII